MTTFDIAHIREQGQDVILVLVSAAFGSQGSAAQANTLAALQVAARNAGLAGTVAAVWVSGNRVHSYGPRAWSGFLSSLTPEFVAANVNRTLTCN